MTWIGRVDLSFTARDESVARHVSLVTDLAPRALPAESIEILDEKEDAMRNKLIVIGAVALIAYVVGTRTPRVQVKDRESVGHQIVRLWNDPRARKRRHKAAKKAAAAAEKRAKKTLHDMRK